MKKMTKYFLIFHTGMLLVTGLGMWFILKFFFLEMLLKSYPLIPIFFYLLGLVFIYVFNHNSLDKPEKIVNTYMLMRMIKIFVSAMLLFIYWIVDKDHIRNFAIIFVIFYVINLIWETYIYLRMEMYIKYKGDQKKPPRERID
ncbi:MAG: hypothetical protein WCR50_03110 [Proteiniphilum sp.]